MGYFDSIFLFQLLRNLTRFQWHKFFRMTTVMRSKCTDNDGFSYKGGVQTSLEKSQVARIRNETPLLGQKMEIIGQWVKQWWESDGIAGLQKMQKSPVGGSTSQITNWYYWVTWSAYWALPVRSSHLPPHKDRVRWCTPTILSIIFI